MTRPGKGSIKPSKLFRKKLVHELNRRINHLRREGKL
jgi:hypothetical protein